MMFALAVVVIALVWLFIIIPVAIMTARVLYRWLTTIR